MKPIRPARRIFIALCLLLSLTAAGARAQLQNDSAAKPTVAAVEIEGEPSQEVPPEAAQLLGKPFTKLALRSALRSLYQNSGRYAQIYAYKQTLNDGNVKIVLRLIPKIRVHKVEFHGNRKLDDDQLKRAVRLNNQTEYFAELLEQDQKRLLERYRAAAFYQTRIEAEPPNPDDETRVVRFRIQEGEQARIEAIRFRAAQELPLAFSDETLRRQLEIADPPRIDRLAQRLTDFYRKQRYHEAQAELQTPQYDPDRNALAISFRIQEGPQTQMRFQGDLQFSESRLQKAAALERVNAQTVENARRNLLAFYVKEGYFAAEIQTPPPEISARTAAAVFIVQPGPLLYLSEIRFVGNEAFSDRTLRRQIQTKTRSRRSSVPILKWLFPPSRLNTQTLEQDKNALKIFYRQAGYPDAQIKAEPALSPGLSGSQTRLAAQFEIQEGEQALVQEVRIEGASDDMLPQIRKIVRSQPGQPYNPDRTQDDARRIAYRYAENGRPYAETNARYNDGALVFRIQEGPEAAFGAIQVQSAQNPLKTKPNVILRELAIRPGDLYHPGKIDRSRQQLLRLGFFQSVEIAAPGLAARSESLDANVIVQERKTGSLNFSGGYSPSEGARASAEIVQRNWLGTGRLLGSKIRLGTRGTRLEAYFIEPWTFGYNARSTFRAFRDNLEEQDNILTWGATLNIARRLGLHNQAAVQYRNQRFQADGQSGQTVQIQPTLSAASLAFTRDTRNSLLNPTKGWLHNATFETAGGPILGGETSIVKLSANARTYRSSGNLTLAAQLRIGFASTGQGAELVSSTERFHLGGSSTIRGYPERSLGTPDAFENYRGNIMLLANAELRVPLVGPFGLAAFVDAGNLWESAADIQTDPLKTAAGAGIRAVTPIGPIRLEAGIPLAKLRGETLQPRYWIEIGNPF